MNIRLISQARSLGKVQDEYYERRSPGKLMVEEHLLDLFGTRQFGISRCILALLTSKQMLLLADSISSLRDGARAANTLLSRDHERKRECAGSSANTDRRCSF